MKRFLLGAVCGIVVTITVSAIAQIGTTPPRAEIGRYVPVITPQGVLVMDTATGAISTPTKPDYSRYFPPEKGSK